jgi:hypothetical protein
MWESNTYLAFAFLVSSFPIAGVVLSALYRYYDEELASEIGFISVVGACLTAFLVPFLFYRGLISSGTVEREFLFTCSDSYSFTCLTSVGQELFVLFVLVYGITFCVVIYSVVNFSR